MNSKNDLFLIQKELNDSVKPIPGVIDKALKTINLKPTLHSRLVLYFINLASKKIDQKIQINLAAAIELLYYALTIHSKITSNKVKDNTTVYAGDYLFMLSLDLLNNTISDPKIINDNLLDLQNSLLDHTNNYPENTVSIYELACAAGILIADGTKAQYTAARKIGHMLDIKKYDKQKAAELLSTAYQTDPYALNKILKMN